MLVGYIALTSTPVLAIHGDDKPPPKNSLSAHLQPAQEVYTPVPIEQRNGCKAAFQGPTQEELEAIQAAEEEEERQWKKEQEEKERLRKAEEERIRKEEEEEKRWRRKRRKNVFERKGGKTFRKEEEEEKRWRKEEEEKRRRKEQESQASSQHQTHEGGSSGLCISSTMNFVLDMASQHSFMMSILQEWQRSCFHSIPQTRLHGAKPVYGYRPSCHGAVMAWYDEIRTLSNTRSAKISSVWHMLDISHN
ncbi:hypothetical protein BASA81_012682 [Batrachochytrium salamandrivorans]|nr:hypothetical protein BASA81_012682 [Batrachochytrium salamandrivorans]